MVSCAVAEVDAASVTVMVAAKVPAVELLPPTVAAAPLAVSVTPAGRPAAVKAYGGVPPLAVNDPLKAALTPAPTTRFDVLSFSAAEAATTVRESGALRLWLETESVAVTVMVDDPAAVGVPLRTPAEDNDKPLGSPEADHANVPEPPRAFSVTGEYAWPRVAFGSESVVMESCVKTASDTVRVTAGELPSFTWTVKPDVPATLGLPLKVPFDESAIPAGGAPENRDHV